MQVHTKSVGKIRLGLIVAPAASREQPSLKLRAIIPEWPKQKSYATRPREIYIIRYGS